MKKLMAMTGQAGRAALEISGEGGATRARLRPQREGELYLCGGSGALFRVDGNSACPFEPVGAVLVSGGRIALHGGFAGRQELLALCRRRIAAMTGQTQRPQEGGGSAVPGGAARPPQSPQPGRQGGAEAAHPGGGSAVPGGTARPTQSPQPGRQGGAEAAHPGGGSAVPGGTARPTQSPQPGRQGGAEAVSPGGGSAVPGGTARPTQSPQPGRQGGAAAVSPGGGSAVPGGTARPTQSPQPGRQGGRRPESEALSDILRRADALFAPLRDAPPPAFEHEDAPALNPFPRAFPMSRWRITGREGARRLRGELYRSGKTYIIDAQPVPPGRAGRPPGYDRQLRGRDGVNYWVKVSPRP